MRSAVASLILLALAGRCEGFGGTVAAPTLPLSDAGLNAREAFLSALAPLARGFDATADQRKELAHRLDDLAACNPQPTPTAAGLSGDWELIYTDAPDILGLTGPFDGALSPAKLDRIGQRIDEASGTIENVIEYTPAAWVPLDALVRLGAADDRLQQRVLLEYEYDGPRCTAKLAGVSLRARRLLGVSLESASPLTLKGPLTLPFGNFEVLYNDGSLRAVRTQQGYWGVNRRCDEDDGWGA